MAATLYLIPTYLDEQSLSPLPVYILDAVRQCNVFFVENERTARRYLKMLWREIYRRPHKAVLTMRAVKRRGSESCSI